MGRMLSQFALLLMLGSCQTASYEHVVAHASYPRGQCQEVGQVIGNANSRENARTKSINSMRARAANLGANYVRIVAVTAHGGAARGIAFRCH